MSGPCLWWSRCCWGAVAVTNAAATDVQFVYKTTVYVLYQVLGCCCHFSSHRVSEPILLLLLLWLLLPNLQQPLYLRVQVVVLPCCCRNHRTSRIPGCCYWCWRLVCPVGAAWLVPGASAQNPYPGPWSCVGRGGGATYPFYYLLIDLLMMSEF